MNDNDPWLMRWAHSMERKQDEQSRDIKDIKKALGTWKLKMLGINTAVVATVTWVYNMIVGKH